MSFRKRNVVLGSPAPGSAPVPRQDKSLAPGTRPSPLDGRLTTSTGTSSLDQLLAGHAGLPLGTCLLVEEAGTTDFGGILLRYYAAEGLVQGHHVHLLGLGESWRRELPGIAAADRSKGRKAETSDDKMKIAWRYETFGSRTPASRDSQITPAEGQPVFCHSFDLAKRLDNSAIRGQLHASNTVDLLSRSAQSPFKSFVADLTSKIQNSPPSVIHRIVVPSLLSPTMYTSSSCRPQEVLQFLHALRALLRQHPTRAIAMVTLPISLFPRSTGLTRWAELLSDGVLELVPLQHQSQESRDASGEDKMQGLLRAHSLPVFHEKGGGLEGGWKREDLSFKLSSSSGLVITPFSLPPVGDDAESPASQPSKKAEAKKEGLDF